MKWTLQTRWVIGGFGISVLLLGAMNLVSYRNATRLAKSTDKVKQTHEVLEALTNIKASLNEAEAGRRGYIFFGDNSEFNRYILAIQRIPSQIDNIRHLVSDNADQQKRLGDLETSLSGKVELFQQSINLYQSESFSLADQASLAEASNQKRTELQRIIADMQSREEDELNQWVQQSQNSIRVRMMIELAGTILSFAALSGIHMLVYMQMLKRQQAADMQRALEQEKELSQLKLNFFSMVSHEFRTPLSIIMGSAQLLAEHLHPEVSANKLKSLHRIQSSARVMTKLLADVLTLARAEAGKLECQPQWVELQSFCLNLLEDIRLSQETKHSIQFFQQGPYTHAYVDENLLYSIISNLLSNAIKYSSVNKEIIFRLICKENAVVFQVQDQGIGIPIESQSQLYTPFHRGENVKGIVGTGLGLTVVKTCLDLHYGTIEVNSQEKIGTTFTIRIPQSYQRKNFP